MLSTFDPSSCSMARLIWTLFAFGATWKTMVRPSSRRIDVFSVISGRRSTSVNFIIFTAALCEGLLQLLDCAWGRDYAFGVRHLPRRQPTARHQIHAGDISQRARQLLVRRHVDEHRLAADPQPNEQLRGGFRLDLARRQLVDDD